MNNKFKLFLNKLRSKDFNSFGEVSDFLDFEIAVYQTFEARCGLKLPDYIINLYWDILIDKLKFKKVVHNFGDFDIFVIKNKRRYRKRPNSRYVILERFII